MKSARWVVAVVGISFVVSASVAQAAGTCGKGGMAPVLGAKVDKSTSDGAASYYFLFVPEAYKADKPMPLVIGLHGDDGSPDGQYMPKWKSVWEGAKASTPFILVMPKCPYGPKWWNNTKPLNASAAFVSSIVDDLAARYNIDTNRIYAHGFSGGGTFLATWGVVEQHKFAGVALNSGGVSSAFSDVWPDKAKPMRDDCKIAYRACGSMADGLQKDVRTVFIPDLMGEGHDASYVEASCSGHCYDDKMMGPDLLAWFLTRTKCQSDSSGCGKWTDIPPAGGGSGGSGGGGAGGAGGSAGSGGAGSGGGGTGGSGGSAGSGGNGGSGGNSGSGGNGGSGAGSKGGSAAGGCTIVASVDVSPGFSGGAAFLSVVASAFVGRRRGNRRGFRRS